MKIKAPSLTLTELSARKFGATDKATKYHAIAQEVAQYCGESYAIGTSSNTYEPTLLRVTKDNCVRVESLAAFRKLVADLFSKYETHGTLMREVVPLALNAIADKSCMRLIDIRPFLFKTQALGDPDVFAWNRLAFDPDPNAPEVPEYEAMRSRTNADAFRAQTEFFGSILDYEFMIEQYLHFSGEGNDGKSSLLQAIRGALPDGFGTDISADDLHSPHGTEKLEGKRLLVFSEQNNSSFMSSGKFKQLTGRDPISINPKNLKEREIVPNCRIIVTSNNRPTVSGKSADMRRIIPVFYSTFGDGLQGDQGWQKRLLAAGPAILSYCYSQFLKNVKEAGVQRIRPDAEYLDEVAEMSSGRELEVEFERFFEPTPDEGRWVPVTRAMQIVRDAVRDRHEKLNLKAFVRGLTVYRKFLLNGQRGPRLLKGWAIRGTGPVDQSDEAF